MVRFVSCLVVVLTPALVLADFAIPMPTPMQKTLHAEYVIVGKIVEVEKESVAATPYPLAEGTIDYTMTTIKINDRLLGAGGITQVRVGFAPMNLGPRRGRIALPVKTTVGTEGCFFLVPHSSGDFFVPVPWATPLDATAPDYVKQLADIKKMTAVLAEPVTSLKAKSKEDRAYAAHVLMQRYGSSPSTIFGAVVTRQELSAEESKLILSAMLEMPWTANAAGVARGDVWNLLQLTNLDKFQPPPAVAGGDAAKAMDSATRQWLTDNLDTYRVKRYVAQRKK